jgi:hypothetical protein
MCLPYRPNFLSVVRLELRRAPGITKLTAKSQVARKNVLLTKQLASFQGLIGQAKINSGRIRTVGANNCQNADHRQYF